MLTIVNHYDSICFALCVAYGREERGEGEGWWLQRNKAPRGGGFARVDIPISRGMGPWVVNPLPLTACPLFVLDLVIPRFPFCSGVNIIKIINMYSEMRFVHR